MAAYFLDSSALVKRYVAETGSPWVVSLAQPAAGHHLYVARMAAVEFASAVARRLRTGSLAPAAVLAARTQFNLDFTSQYRIVEITDLILTRAAALAEKHALRAYDAVQLSAAVEVNGRRLARSLPALTLVSADVDLNAAATTEGLGVEDPNAHP